MSVTTTPPQWATPKQIPTLESAFTEPAVRWHVFNAKNNGLEPHIRRVGRKVLINVQGFREWIATQSA